ncbi:MAG: hypothetical protein ACLTTP_06575 [Alistipes ihumii]
MNEQFFAGQLPSADTRHNDRPDRVCVFRRYEKKNGQWRETAYPLRSNVGRAGIAPYGEKREGDGRTPSGAYPMGFAFGYVRDIDLSWPFVVVSKQHYWISDPEDPLYNQMTQQTPRTDNFEYLRRDDEVYRYAAVVEYNMRPIEEVQKRDLLPYRERLRPRYGRLHQRHPTQNRRGAAMVRSAESPIHADCYEAASSAEPGEPIFRLPLKMCLQRNGTGRYPFENRVFENSIVPI